ncbi:MAG: AMP-binding protein, partial [Candidatus Bathyarchaeia archaeon]
MKKGEVWVVKDPERDGCFWPSKEMKKVAWVNDESIYKEAAKDRVSFWSKLAKEGITWIKEWDEPYRWEPPYYKWFINAKLNVCYNAVDRHVETWRRNKAAIIWEPEPPDEPNRILTYYDLYREVNKFANVLKKLGVRKGDRVGIYLPMIPEVHIAMLACARIGAIHSVVFSAFSAESLKSRMLDAEPKVLVTADGYYRRGEVSDLKSKADEAVEGTTIKHVVVVRRAGNEVKMVEGRDHWWHELMKDASHECKPEAMDSEDTLFILYTSGTTGKPKGVVHSTGGYATQAYWTTKWDFD